MVSKVDQAEQLPYLPHLSTIPNLTSASGFVYGIEAAFLGNSLSTFANLIGFSIRTNTPVIYPQLMEHAELFDFSKVAMPYSFSPVPISIDHSGLHALQNFIASAMEGYYDGYMRAVRTVPPEWLSHLGGLSNATVFLRYDMQFSDWGVYESTVSTCASKGNAVVLPGAYWWQYRDMPVEAAEAIRERLPIKHTDMQYSRSARMRDAASGLRIGIHVRLGDYQNFMDGQYYWSIDVYAGLMQAMSRELGSQPHVFVLCSNGEWTSDHLDGLSCCYERGSSFDDFVALSKCDVIVGPPSTYANWAAFLGKARRLVLTPEIIASFDDVGLQQAKELPFPTGSGIKGDYWRMPQS